jgi:hypothetical protein
MMDKVQKHNSFKTKVMLTVFFNYDDLCHVYVPQGHY